MKKTRSGDQPRTSEEEMLPEYHFDYRKARSNRFATQMKPGSRAVVLEPDVAQVFTSPESVNDVRALIKTMPRKVRARQRRN